jgi:DNA-binding XRE family transcriptional regulator
MIHTRIDVQLKPYLEQIGVTAYTLGKWVVGVSPQTIYAVANGSRRPSLEVLEAILDAFHDNGFETTLSDLLSTHTE